MDNGEKKRSVPPTKVHRPKASRMLISPLF